MAAHLKRGQMLDRGPNKWLLRIYRGRVAGKKQYSSKTVTGTTAQARQALTAMLREEDTDTFVPSSKLTLRDYLDQWLAGKIDVSAKTLSSYTDQLRHFDTIGSLRITDLDTLAIQRCVKKMIEKGLSPRSVEYSVRVLHGALESAELQRNPALKVIRPKRVKRGASVLTLSQVNTLLEKTAGTPAHPLWRLLLTSGMRPQEAFALKWSDLELDAGWLSVRRVLVSDGEGGTALVEGAKADSERRIALPESTVACLRDHRKSQARTIISLGSDYNRQDLVFANRFGRPLDVARVRRWWKKALSDAGLPEIRLYDARHTHLTALLASGADIAWVSARAGHKDLQTTRDHYAHVLPEVHREMGLMTERMMQAAK